MTKNEIISELLAKGVEFNPKSTKKELLSILHSIEAHEEAEELAGEIIEPEYVYHATYKAKQHIYELGTFDSVEEAKNEARKRGVVHLYLSKELKK